MSMRRSWTILGMLLTAVLLLAGLWALRPAAAQAAPAATHTVTKTADTNDAVCDSDCSLREAVATATSGDTITFDAGLAGQTITLTLGEITIDKDLSIDASTLSAPVTINGNNASRIFNITGGTVTLDSLRLVNGNADQSQGGALYIDVPATTVDIIDSTFANNFATYDGGAIYNATSLDVTGSTFVENESGTSFGGAIINLGTTTITNNTFTHNSALQSGALMNENNSTMYVYNNTFVDNIGVSGASIGNRDIGTITIANNIAAGSGPQCYNQNGTMTSIANWFEHGSCSAAYSGNPYLAALDDNGGPTETHALMPFSGAVGAGNSTYCPASDQRGVSRATNCDLGAFEVQPADYQSVCRSGLAQGETYIFGSTGISTTIDTLGSLTQLCVTLHQSNHPNATAGLQTGLYWDVSATAGSNDWSLTMSAPATFALDGSDKLCRYPGGVGGAGWDCGAPGDTIVSGDRVTRSGITQLSDWAVGDNVGPTSVTLHSATAQAGTAPTTLVELVLLLGAAGALVLYTQRKK